MDIYDGNKLNLTTPGIKVDVSQFKPNPGWDVVGTTAQRHVKTYTCCPEPYINLTYSITIKLQRSDSGKMNTKSNKLDLN